MFSLKEFMKNLILYGHTKIFTPIEGHPTKNYIIYLYFDIDSNLIIDEGIYIFDRPFWDGYTINSKAKVKKIYMNFSYSSLADIVSYLAKIITASFYNHGLYQTADEVYDLNDNSASLEVVYKYIMSSIDLDNATLYKISNSNDIDIFNEILANVLKKYKDFKTLPFSEDFAPKMIEKKWNDVMNRFYTIQGIVKASEENLSSHTKKILDKSITNISTDKTKEIVKLDTYIKRRH